MRNLFLSAALLMVAWASAGEVPPPPDGPVGMERGGWSLEPWGNSGAAERTLIKDKKVLKLIYTADKKDKAAFKHLTYLGLAKDGKVRLHVYSGEDSPPKVGLAISTTRAYRWHESKPCDLKKGWNKLEFSVGAKDWKTESSQWKHTAAVEPIDQVRAVDIVIYNGENSGVLLAYGLQYDPDERGKQVAGLIKDLQSEDLELRGKAEKALVLVGRPAMEALYQVADDERPEVLLRAASALRQIEEVPEELPADPTVREQYEKQREEQNFDEARRRADYALRALDNERAKLLGLLKEAQAELTLGRTELDQLKFVDVEKRKLYAAALDKIEAALKEVQPLVKPAPKP